MTDSLISAYGSLLQALLTIAALVNLFITILFNAKLTDAKRYWKTYKEKTGIVSPMKNQENFLIQ